MITQFIQDMYEQLERELPQQAGIQLSADLHNIRLQDMAVRLHHVEMAHKERLALLGCYALVLLSLRIHDQLPTDPAAAGRSVLDGDFIMSFYLQFALRHGFIDLIAELAPVIKQVQIKRAEQKLTDEANIHKQTVRFIAKRYKKLYPLTQTFKQVTYDVV
ncbi:adenylate kinase and related kinase [Paenibacillus sp. SC116]|uniref:adenylate kinase and related kinase n=1 Tax=Paenibacillus sp. SC116 TaxID=2968986 RepID=UPI00215A587D|nr:adenylate kinase and related kinase [Paenibacillus sp. SC116]MCR8844676.1 adenylate kinase and related kinase [Paenibacillus sp. SC116]